MTKTARTVNDDTIEYINGNGEDRTVTTVTAGTIARVNGKNSNNDKYETRAVNDGKTASDKAATTTRQNYK